MIHHTNKGAGNAYTRARGSSDIVYAMDAGIDVRPTEPYTEGMFITKLFRSRRRKAEASSWRFPCDYALPRF